MFTQRTMGRGREICKLTPALDTHTQIGYVVLVVGGFGLFILEAYPLIPNNYMAGYHKYSVSTQLFCWLCSRLPLSLTLGCCRYIGLACMVSCLSIFVICSTTSAGKITPGALAANRWPDTRTHTHKADVT